MNLVMTQDGKFIEVQGTAEASPFGRDRLFKMLELGEKGIRQLIAAQKQALGEV